MDKNEQRAAELTGSLQPFYGEARSIFMHKGYDSVESQELRHYAAEWIARLQVENEKLQGRVNELELELENSAGWLENKPVDNVVC